VEVRGVIPESVNVAGTPVAVWPAGIKIQMLAAPNMAVVDFSDCDRYHTVLAARIFEMEKDPRYRDWIFKGGCGTKVRDPQSWECPEADLIHARAMRLAAKALSAADVVVDSAWANIYRKGDYCMPHSHLRSTASLIYLLEPGEVADDDVLGGRLCFCDPRIPFCCAHEPGRMTQLFTPEIRAGSLLVFPSEYIHAVNPYGGTRPRISMSWNINLEKLPGDRSQWSRGAT
jgi:hypothetical protein